MTWRYVFLGDRMTDPALVGQPCDPVRRADGRCIISVRMATALVVFPDGVRRVVPRRRLRIVAKFNPYAPTGSAPWVCSNGHYNANARLICRYCDVPFSTALTSPPTP